MNTVRYGVRGRVRALKRRRVAAMGAGAGRRRRAIRKTGAPARVGIATSRDFKSGDTSPHSKGFSLIEVMVAVVILGVSLVGLVHGINTALVSGKESEIQSQAALLAAGKIESVRADGLYVEGETTGEFDGDLSIYSYRQNIEAREPQGLYEVTVAIEKTDSGEQIYELKTMLFDPPITREDDDQTGKDKDRERRKRNQ